jgi:biotin-(acetyl-CoA carboxylase) ligase
MIVLSDCPHRLADLARAEDGAKVCMDELSPGDRALWRVLGEGRRLWRGTATDPGPPGFWSSAVVVGEARSSQFDALQEALASGVRLAGPTASIALSGHQFHGQHSRPWMARPGNLHLCAAFPAPGIAAREARLLPALPAVAVVEAVHALTGGALRPGIKWVNDLLVGGRKIGGVLTATQVQGDDVSSALLGIGLNVATTPLVPATPFVPSVGCLADEGVQTSWAEAAVLVLAALGRRLAEMAASGPGALLDAYRASSVVIDREVCLFADSDSGGASSGTWSTPALRGTVRGIDGDLSLLLEGVETSVSSGRLAFAVDCRDIPT